MSIIKSRTLTICSYHYLKKMLEFFDNAILNDPTLSTDENRCLRKLFDEVLEESILGICVYNSQKMLKKCETPIKC